MASEFSANSLVQSLCGVLTQVAEPKVVLTSILEQAVTETDANRGVIVEVTRDGQLRLDYTELYRFEQEDWRHGPGKFSRTIISEVVASGQVELMEDAARDPRFTNSASVHELRLVSVLCMPIKVEGRVVAVVHLEKNRPNSFLPRHERLLDSLAMVAGPVLTALRAGRQIISERDSYRDSTEQLAAEVDANREVLSRDWSFGRFLGRSPEIRALADLVRRAASTEFPVLVTGETGTGKSLLARIIHSSGTRAKEAFVTVFCPALQREMVESTLFGHRSGAFTGASRDRDGNVQAAEKGTLFLDEVGELPVEIQPKLLRLLHEKTFERVGDNQESHADVRVIAATNKQLEEAISSGTFREDLYQRLNFIPIRIPPLRERREDIPLLVRHALDQTDSGRWLELAADSEEFLVDVDYAWPGNVREIEQLAARLIMDVKKGPIEPATVKKLLEERTKARSGSPGVAPASAGPWTPGVVLQDQVDRFEKQVLTQAIRENRRLTRKQLADRLGISERTLYKKLEKYDLFDHVD